MLTDGYDMSTIKIAAIADVHCPRYLDEFKTALSKCDSSDLLLFAGDMINRGKAEEYIRVLEAVETELDPDIPIVACFGNEDPPDIYDELHPTVRNRIRFLHEESAVYNFYGSRVGIIGMSGVGAEFRSTEVVGMKDLFEERASRLSSLLYEVSKQSDTIILLMHYSPLLENSSTEFSWWMSRALEHYIPSHIVHGHIHDSVRQKVEIEATTVWNVALPLTRKITELNL